MMLSIAFPFISFSETAVIGFKLEGARNFGVALSYRITLPITIFIEPSFLTRSGVIWVPFIPSTFMYECASQGQLK